MTGSLDLCARLVRVTAAAGTGDRAPVAGAVLEELERASGAAALSLQTRDPFTGAVRPVAHRGYDARVLAHLSGPAFLSGDAGYQLLAVHQDRPARSWNDVEGYSGSPSVQRVFRPAGFCGGATARLVTADGRYTGDVHLSTRDERGTTAAVVDALCAVGPLLAAAVDESRSWREARGVLDAEGTGLAFAVGPRGVHPLTPAARRHALQGLGVLERVVAHGRVLEGAWLVPVGAGWCSVRSVPVPGGALVLARPAELPAGLTARELDVLTLLAEGLTNDAVARRTSTSSRTVAHHVEHLLAKLGVSGRVAAVVLAVERGWRLLPAG